MNRDLLLLWGAITLLGFLLLAKMINAAYPYFF